ncbi:MAG: phosphohistidine phosphatase [Deltaproteobacteria bacterium]|nr:MAG: phosphohistidine phosphatase [Deltaproteobacteria bacterium]
MVKIRQKTLVLIRHAKSSWSRPELADYDRPLNKRGKRDAPLMGRQLAARQVFPVFFISSPAKRARKTAEKIAAELDFPIGRLVYQPDIYHGGRENILQILHQIDEQHSTVFLVGHNPAITGLAESLGSMEIDNVPTAGLVGIGFDGKWRDLGSGIGQTLFFDYPKKFRTK